MATLQEVLNQISGNQTQQLTPPATGIPSALPQGSVREDFLPALEFPPTAPINQPAQLPAVSRETLPFEGLGVTTPPTQPQSEFSGLSLSQGLEAIARKNFAPDAVEGSLLARPFKAAVGAAADLSRFGSDALKQALSGVPVAPVTPFEFPDQQPINVMTPLERAYVSSGFVQIPGVPGLAVIPKPEAGKVENFFAELGYDVAKGVPNYVDKLLGFFTGTAEQLVLPERHGDITPGHVGAELATGAKDLIANAILAGGHRIDGFYERVIEGVTPLDPEFYETGTKFSDIPGQTTPIEAAIEFVTGKPFEDALRDAVIQTQQAPEDILFGLQIGRALPKQVAGIARGGSNLMRRVTGREKINVSGTEADLLTDKPEVTSDRLRRAETQGIDQFRRRQIEEAFGEEIPLTEIETQRLQGRPDLLRRHLTAEEGIGEVLPGIEQLDQPRLAEPTQIGPTEASADVFRRSLLENERIRQSQQGQQLLTEQLRQQERIAPSEPPKFEKVTFTEDIEAAAPKPQKPSKAAPKKQVEPAEIAEKVGKVKFDGELLSKEDIRFLEEKGKKVDQAFNFTITEKGKETTLSIPVKGFSEAKLRERVTEKLEKIKEPTPKTEAPKEITEPSLKAEPGATVEEVRLIDSIREGQLILESGKKVSGKKMTAEELKVVEKSIESSKKELLELQKPTEKKIEPGDIAKGGAAGLATAGAVKLLSDDDTDVGAAALFPLLLFGKKKKGGKGEITAALKELKKGKASPPLVKLREIHKGSVAPEHLRTGFKISPEELKDIKRQAAKETGIKLKERSDGSLVAPPGAGVKLSRKMDQIRQQRLLDQAKEAGIAVRTTKTGRPVPNVRKSGIAVPIDFAKYKSFKDVKAGIFGGTKDITRIIQEADGSLSAKQKVDIPGQAGPLEQNVLFRTRDLEKSKFEWMGEQQDVLNKIFEGLSKDELKNVTTILEGISPRGAFVDAKLLRNKFKGVTTDIDLIKRAQELRKWYDSALSRQNEVRSLREQSEIPRRQFYSPQELQEVSLWQKTFGLRKVPEDIMTRPELPDYIKPDAQFNPRAMAREAEVPNFLQERNAAKLAENYANTAAADIFNTSIIQNNKAFAQQMESMGFENTARAIQDWTAESYAGVRSSVDRAAALHPTVRKGMRFWRRALNRSVFPLNLSWNMIVQTSSANLTVARYGGIASAKGLKNWFLDPSFRKQARDNAYSLIVKSQKVGKISQQDVAAAGIGIVKTAATRTKLDSVVDAANLLTETIEGHLTGWSVATAFERGKKLGLEGKALWEYASDGGAKTQSMYNNPDLPGMLRSEIVKTIAPFQTFSFELFNTLREVGGRTGMSPGTFKQRVAFVIRLVGGGLAINYAGNAISGREPWSIQSFIPFYSTLFEPVQNAFLGKTPVSGSGRGLPAPTGIGVQFGQAVHKYFQTGDETKLRQFMIRYLPGMAGIPGGTQINRTVDGLIAVSQGGVFDSAGRLKFPVTEQQDQMKAILGGPFTTGPGKEFIQERKEGILDKILSEVDPEKRQKAAENRVINLISFGNEKLAREEFNEWNDSHPDNKLDDFKRLKIKGTSRNRDRQNRKRREERKLQQEKRQGK